MKQSISPAELEKLAATLKVLSHPSRLRIIEYLGQPAKTPSSVTDIYRATELPQAIASQHLITLKDRGILTSNKVGTKIYYAVAQPWVLDVLAILKKQVA